MVETKTLVCPTRVQVSIRYWGRIEALSNSSGLGRGVFGFCLLLSLTITPLITKIESYASSLVGEVLLPFLQARIEGGVMKPVGSLVSTVPGAQPKDIDLEEGVMG